MKKILRQNAIALIIALALTQASLIAPAQAITIPEWPSSELKEGANTYDPETAVTNTGAIWMVVDNSSGTPLKGIGVQGSTFLPFGLTSGAGVTVNQSPTAASPFVFSSSGILETEVWFASGSGGRITEYQITDVNAVFFRIDDGSGGAWTGEFNIKIKPGQLTSQPSAFTKEIRVQGADSLLAGQHQAIFEWPASQQNPNQTLTAADAPAPAKYSGPEFSALSGMGIMTGSTGKLEGKRLNEISSIEIGGKAATFTATSDEEIELALPAGLAPGLYDLVINSSAGKLTHINAIQVRAPKQSFSIMTRSQGKISNDQYLEHSLIASMQIPELNKARCVVNASSMAMAKAMANRLCAVVKASNPNIETTIVEPRSTVKGDAVYARVSYGWN